LGHKGIEEEAVDVRGFRRLIHAVESRTASAYDQLVRSAFLDPYLPGTAGIDAHLKLLLEQQRLSLIETFKVRADGRGVYLVRDAEGAACVLKTWYTPTRLDRGLAYMYKTDALQGGGYDLFPRVFEARPGYTLEAYVRGPLLGQCPEDEVDEQDVRDFLRDLKSWSREFSKTHAVLPGEFLEPFEVEERCRDMIGRAFGHSQYRSPRHIPRYLHRFHKRKDALRSSVHDLMDMANRIPIPRYVMCGDVHPGNIIVDQQSGRFLIVDFETLNDGHYGFDLANLSSQVYRLGLTSRISDSLNSHLEDSGYMEREDVGRFFRKLDRILKEILGVIFDVADNAVKAGQAGKKTV
jgi:hypothetical protein